MTENKQSFHFPYRIFTSISHNKMRKNSGRKEVITDNIVRDFFLQYNNEVIIEQQSSENPIIDKLLRNASKKGDGKGYPDFIIQYKNDKNFLIVIENKADSSYHESDSHKQYTQYAVDGVLLYASFLSKSFDVLAIAISGTDRENLKISHYLHLKDEPSAFPYFGDTLLSPNDYYIGLNLSEEKKRQDYDKLLDYTRVLNTRLHTMKIDEAERCILASCILLALRLPRFKSYYKTEDNQQILVNNMVNDVLNWFKKENVEEAKIKVLESKYATIRGMFSDPKDNKDLVGLISDMEENIDNFERTNRYYDVLGQLYVAFLRYANTSNDLGVVLTPTHITEFFSDIACVTKDSIVFDNCTGTCGFLIAAMSKMIKDANGDKSVEKSIKQYQLVGIEYADKMYCLAASNMAIHGDGKTNIYFNSGISSEIIEDVKQRKASDRSLRPTVGLLNPPYKADKKTDVEELEFVKWNLEALVQGGTCVAIVPMQCAIAETKKKKIYELKKELLSKHTLEAVFSMPDELFYNSDKSVVTCIMVFTAHRPHPQGKETFFGYFKDDGFEKRKKLGRIDIHGRWNKIKEEWLNLYRNRKEVAGKSVMHYVTAKDEWCAEAYMETDYNTLTKEMFEKTIRNYITSQICFNRIFTDIVYKPQTSKNITLDTDKWEWFRLESDTLFSVEAGHYYYPDEYVEGETPYCSASAGNNGVGKHIDLLPDFDGNKLIVGKIKCPTFYQPRPFCATSDVNVLTPKFNMSPSIGLFIATIIERGEGYKWNYGRQCRVNDTKNIRIKLPVDSSGNPDWQFMEDFIKSLPYSSNLT